jgi:hypothetical protein
VSTSEKSQKQHSATAGVPEVSSHRIAEDTWLIPNLAHAGPGVYLPVNTMVIRGQQPIVVDTGAPIHRDSWFKQSSRCWSPRTSARRGRTARGTVIRRPPVRAWSEGTAAAKRC